MVALIYDIKSEPPKLGLNFFKPYKIEFDFINHQLSKTYSQQFDIPFELGPKGHIHLEATFGSQRIACIYDSGAGLLVVDSEFIRKYPVFLICWIQQEQWAMAMVLT